MSRSYYDSERPMDTIGTSTRSSTAVAAPGQSDIPSQLREKECDKYAHDLGDLDRAIDHCSKLPAILDQAFTNILKGKGQPADAAKLVEITGLLGEMIQKCDTITEEIESDHPNLVPLASLGKETPASHVPLEGEQLSSHYSAPSRTNGTEVSTASWLPSAMKLDQDLTDARPFATDVLAIHMKRKAHTTDNSMALAKRSKVELSRPVDPLTSAGSDFLNTFDLERETEQLGLYLNSWREGLDERATDFIDATEALIGEDAQFFERPSSVALAELRIAAAILVMTTDLPRVNAREPNYLGSRKLWIYDLNQWVSRLDTALNGEARIELMSPESRKHQKDAIQSFQGGRILRYISDPSVCDLNRRQTLERWVRQGNVCHPAFAAATVFYEHMHAKLLTQDRKVARIISSRRTRPAPAPGGPTSTPSKPTSMPGGPARNDDDEEMREIEVRRRLKWLVDGIRGCLGRQYRAHWYLPKFGVKL